MSTPVSKLMSYPTWLADRMGPLRKHGIGLPDPARDGFGNADLVGYPNNHNYFIDDHRLIPTFDLYWRTQIVEQLYSDPVVNLLDVGSCKGWFVLRAAQRSDCKRALGIDIFAPWIELSNRVASFQEITKASFRVAFLREVFERPEEFGAPFGNILILNTYHYLFWGSGMYPDHFANHEEILEGLHRICSNRVIFANPVDLAQVPRETKQIAAADAARSSTYTEARFLAAAAPFFDVQSRGRIGKRRLVVLHRR